MRERIAKLRNNSFQIFHGGAADEGCAPVYLLRSRSWPDGLPEDGLMQMIPAWDLSLIACLEI